MIALVFLYLTACIFIYGGELNARHPEGAPRDAIEGSERSSRYPDRSVGFAKTTMGPMRLKPPRGGSLLWTLRGMVDAVGARLPG